MKVLITGQESFIGKNLIAELKSNYTDIDILEYDFSSKKENLDPWDLVIHLETLYRSDDKNKFMDVNYGLTKKIIKLSSQKQNKPRIIYISSTQATLDNPYGLSKKKAEDLILEYEKKYNCKTNIFRLPNEFGKWSIPNFNNVIATFCYNISRDKDITISNRQHVLKLVYIDDIIYSIIDAMYDEKTKESSFCDVTPVYTKTLGDIANYIYEFKKSRKNFFLPHLNDEFIKKLYSTYLSFLPEDEFSYDLVSHIDSRGSFTEILKTTNMGQVSVNVAKPHIVKGNHWHHTKNEKFLVVAGTGVIRFKKYGENKIYEYFVSDKEFKVVDIPCGYVHNIENLGSVDMVTIMWANETFDPDKPDTKYMEVK